jgi:hypothetical protein
MRLFFGYLLFPFFLITGDYSFTKEESCTSKTPRKHHAKSKRKPEIKSSSSQGEIENMQIYRTDQPEDKDVFLPRLTGSSSRASPDNKSQDGSAQQLRLPEIRIVQNNYSRMALNRSITDLLDPEMEILNKVSFVNYIFSLTTKLLIIN